MSTQYLNFLPGEDQQRILDDKITLFRYILGERIQDGLTFSSWSREGTVKIRLNYVGCACRLRAFRPLGSRIVSIFCCDKRRATLKMFHFAFWQHPASVGCCWYVTLWWILQKYLFSNEFCLSELMTYQVERAIWSGNKEIYLMPCTLQPIRLLFTAQFLKWSKVNNTPVLPALFFWTLNFTKSSCPGIGSWFLLISFIDLKSTRISYWRMRYVPARKPMEMTLCITVKSACSSYPATMRHTPSAIQNVTIYSPFVTTRVSFCLK